MTLFQRDNISSERLIPQWKKELITRKRASSTRAGSHQTMTHNTFGVGHVGKQRDVIITANESAVDHSRQPDFHLQQRASFGVAERLFVPAVDNMKLLNEVGVRDSTVRSRVRVSNVSKAECVRENYVKHVIEMNEEKCYDKFRFAIEKFSPNSRVKIRSLSPPTNNEEDNSSDSSEELQYGPGIVNKLKTKYLSMTLRENQKKGVRPSLSNMRKASSLDNLLDEDIMNNDKSYQISSVISCVNKLEYSTKESEACLTLNFCADLKRARSMETLHDDKKDSQNGSSNVKSIVVSKTKVTNQFKPSVKTYNNGLTLLPLDSIVNEDIIIVENTISESKNDSKKRIPLENRELPPPDVVKETLKIFENCQNKSSNNCKSWNGSKFNSAARSPETNSKPKVETKKQVCGKPVLYPKPVISSADTKLKKLPPKKPPTIENDSNGVSNQVNKTEHDDKPNGIVQNGFSGEEKKLNLKNHSTKSNQSEDVDARSSSPVSVLKINFQPNKSPESNTQPSLDISVNGDKSIPDVISINTKNSQKSRSIVSPVVEKLNAGIITSAKKSPPEKLVIENHSPVKNGPSAENEVEETGVRNQMINDNENKHKHDILKPSEGLPVRQVGIIRPLVSNKLNNAQATLTPQEIEKNFINTKKSLDLAEKSSCEKEKDNSSENHSLCSTEQSVNFNNSPNNVNKPSTLWFNKPWNQQENTMVFNFRDRKEVPDYIENDGLLLTSNRDRAKRILQETGGSGYIILGVENGLDNSVNESSTDSPSISCREEWRLISGPPSPCNVHFEGDNVVINGKSNLRKHPREKKLRIQFNDTSTTFEYPSEASLLEEDISSITNGDDDSVSSREMNIVPNSTPNVSAHLSGSSLASYVPSKLSMGECFELGVTRSNGSMANVVNSRVADKKLENPRNTTQQNENSDDYLKPASENENIAWSEESIPDLLF